MRDFTGYTFTSRKVGLGRHSPYYYRVHAPGCRYATEDSFVDKIVNVVGSRKVRSWLRIGMKIDSCKVCKPDLKPGDFPLEGENNG